MKAFLSNKTYDFLKFVAQIVLPALATLYFSLAGFWHFPNPDSVVGTLVAIDVFLGVVLGLSTKVYNASDEKYDGQIDIANTPTGKSFLLNLPGDPHEIEDKQDVLFKVNPPE